MSLNVSEGEFEKCPVGAHPAWCVSVIDLGTQAGEYQGKPKSQKKIWIVFETPTEMMKDGRPFTVSSFYSATLSERSTLRKDLEAWRGKKFTPEELKKFDLKNILGASCLISVIHTEKGKAKINGIMPLPKGMSIPPRINELKSFDIDAFDQAAFDALPDGIKEMIKKSEELSEGPGDMVKESEIPWGK